MTSNSSGVKIETASPSSNEDDSIDPSDNMWECDGGVQLPHNNYGKFGNVLMKKQKKRIHPTEVQAKTKSSKRPRRSRKKCAVIVMADEDEDNSYPVVTVEVETRSECPGQDGAILTKHVQVNLLSHCILCLRKTTKYSIGKHQSSSHFLSTFNCTWMYLQRKNKSGADGDDPLSFLEYISVRETEEKDKMTFLDLPSMCEPCAEKLETVDRLFRELQTQLNVIGRVIPASKCSGKNSRRTEHIKSLLKVSNLEEEVVAATTMVLEKLGGNHQFPCGDGDPLATTDLTPNSGTLTAKVRNKSLVVPEDAKKREKSTVLPERSRKTENDNEVDSLNVHHQESLQDDHWSDYDQDSDYIKPEPDDDFSEDEATSYDDSFTTRTHTTPRENVKTPSFSTALHGKNTTSGQKVEATTTSNKADVPVKVPNDLNETHECNQCGKFFSESSLEHHKLMVHGLAGSILRICDFCKAQVLLKDIPEHARAHVGEDYLIKCPNSDCQGTYTRLSSLRSHLRGAKNCSESVSPVKEFFDTFNICQICGFKAGNGTNLQTHLLREHENPIKSFACPVDGCRQKFSARQSVAFHIARHDIPPKVRQLSCDLCKVEVSSKDFLEHARAHVGDEYLIKCPNPACTRVFCRFVTLKHHITTAISCSKSLSTNVQEFLDTFNICQVCGYKTGSVKKLRAHLLCEHENPTKNLACPIEGCPQRFSARQSVVFHISNHGVPKTVETQSCSDCGTVMEPGEMTAHLQVAHQCNEIISCRRCPFVFSSWEFLVEHMFVHRFGTLSCDMCPGEQVRFSKHVKLQKHYFFKHQIGTRYPCRQCDCVTLSERQLKDHERRYHLGNGASGDVSKKKMQEFLRCGICLVYFMKKSSLQDHNIKEHNGDPFICQFCGATFLTHALHHKHEMQHNGGPEPRFTCDIEGCGKKFMEKKGLQHHIASHHLGEKHVCELCGKAFSSVTNLKGHKNSVHLKLRPFVCEECKESFASRKVLRNHKLIHTGQRDYACEICGQMFRQKVVLNRHVEAHRRKGADFKPNGPMKQIRKRVQRKN